MHITDLSLLERWQQYQDAEAFTELVNRHLSMVYGTSLRILKNQNDAEEVSQECFLQLLQSKTPSNYRSLGGWLYTIAANRSIDRLRKAKRHHAWAEHITKETSKIAEPDLDDISQYVDKAIAGLPEKLRIPLVEHFLEGQTHNDIAKSIGISRSTVSGRIASAIDKIRSDLKRKGIYTSSAALAAFLTAESAQSAPDTLTSALGKVALSGISLNVTSTSTLLGGLAFSQSLKILLIAAILCITIAISYPFIQKQKLQHTSNPEDTFTVTQTPIQLDTPSEHTPPTSNRTTEISGLYISGQVVDTLGNLIEGARIRLGTALEGDVFAEMVTGIDGAFLFTDLPPATPLFCTVKKEGMITFPEEPGWFELVEEPIEELRKTLYIPAHVEGVVVDTKGRFIPDINVWAHWSNDLGLFNSNYATTDNQGRFELTELYPGQQVFSVLPKNNDSRPSLEDLRLALNEGEHRTGVRLVYSETEPYIGGYVVDTNDTPIAKATVQALTEDSPRVFTDESGYFFIPRLSEGAHMITANKEGYENPFLFIEAWCNDAKIELTPQTNLKIKVRVIDEITKSPITFFGTGTIQSIWNNHNVEFEEYGFHPEGQFTLDKLNDKGATIAVQAPGYSLGFCSYTFSEGSSDEELTISLQPSPPLHVIVVDSNDNPVKDATISTDWHYTSYNWSNSNILEFEESKHKTNSDGRYTLSSLPDFAFSICAVHRRQGFGYALIETLKERPDTVKIMLEHGGRIEGNVRMNGESVPNVQLSLFYTDVGDSLNGTLTDSTGAYQLEKLPSGMAEVNLQLAKNYVINGDNHQIQRKGIKIENNKTTRIDFDITPGKVEVNGIVSLAGIPVQNSTIRLYCSTSIDDEVFSTKIQENGYYVFENVPTGPATLSFSTTTKGIQQSIDRYYNLDIPNTYKYQYDVNITGTADITGQVLGVLPFERSNVYLLSGAVKLNPPDVENIFNFKHLFRGHINLLAEQIDYELPALEPQLYTVLARTCETNSSGKVRSFRYATAILDLQENENQIINFNLNP